MDPKPGIPSPSIGGSSALRLWGSVVLMHAFLGLSAQPFVIFNGTAQTCAGALLDSGGQGGSGYGNNENYTYTLCPDNPGDAISVDLITFTLSTAGAAPIDNLTIHDGATTAAPLIGSYTGTSLQGQIISASMGNPTGCLTFVWNSNATGTGVFAGSITCYVPCTRPVASASMGQSAPALICQGDVVNFNGSASYAAPGYSIASYVWDFGDGITQTTATPLVSHAYPTSGGYEVQLQVLDNNGCSSANLTDLAVWVGTTPTFTGTTGDLIGCTGEELCLNGVVNATTWNELPEANFGDGVYLPDNVGSCFTADLVFTQFAPGQTLTNVNQLGTICIDIEHSFLGDLVMSIIAPTGETVILHQQGGGGTFLGDANDNDSNANPVAGTCWTYCFSATATNGTLADNATAPNTVMASQGSSVAPGTYESLNPLSGLVGAQLNGTWTIEICDLWGADNGFLCGWSLTFDPSMYADLMEFTPNYGAGCDSSSWAGPGITSTAAGCNDICVMPAAPGNYTYTYTVTDDLGCTYDTSLTVIVVPDPIVDAGPDLSTCTDPVQLNATASGGFDLDCSYTLQLYDSFGDGWNGGQITISINGVPATYTLTTGSTGTVTLPVSAGDAIQIGYSSGLYNGEVSFELLDGMGTTVFAAGPGPATGILWNGMVSCNGFTAPYLYSWSPSTGLSDPSIADPIATVAGTTVYCVTVTQPGHPECSATDCVTVTVVQDVDAGLNGSTTLCENAAPFDLFPILGGTPDPGGTWYDPNNAVTTSLFDPATSPGGTYTYTVTGVGTCGASMASSTVTVNVIPLPWAGGNGGLSLCASDAPVALINALGGVPDPGGSWTAPGGVPFAGTLDPSVNAAGVYTYTVLGAAPCPDASASVTVTINTPVDAGTDAAIVLCSTDAPVALFSVLGGTPDAGGTWTAPGGVAFAGTLDPSVNAAGVYTYTVLGAAPCPDGSATVTVTINTPVDAGTDAAIVLCSTDAPVALFSVLGGTPDAGGTWTAPGGVAFAGTLDPSVNAAGVYTYTVLGAAPCPDGSATVTVTINTPVDAGLNGSVALCISSPSIDLITVLGGSPNPTGSWTGPGGVSFTGVFVPSADLPGTYVYTVAGTSPCPNDVASVLVNVVSAPDPGLSGSITLCSSGAIVDLFTQLGGSPDAGGTWTGPGGLAFSGLFDPAAHSAGTYTYQINVPPPCVSVSSSVSVNVIPAPDPGSDGAVILCISSPPTALFASLGGTPDAGGTWTGPGGTAFSGTFDPALHASGNYTYTVSGTSPCPAASAVVTVNVVSLPDPGTPGSTTLCTSDAAIMLFNLLGGTPDAGGTWSGPGGTAFSGTFDPATDQAGVYTYTITVPPPCVGQSSTVTVNLSAPPDPGSDGALTLCISSPPTALFASLGGTPDAGGTWTGPGGTAFSGIFDPALHASGNYTYTVSGTSPCPAASAVVTVNVVSLPDPGTPGSTTLCSSDAAIMLFNVLGGTPDAGGTWSGPGGTAFSGTFDPAMDQAGVYTYTIAVPPPCVSQSSTVTVDLSAPPDPGSDGALTLCISSPPTALFVSLGGTPDAGGTWTGPGGTAFSGTFDPALHASGNYIYTVSGTSPCPAASAVVTVNVVSLPDPGTPGSTTLCTSDAAIMLFNVLGGTPDAGGTWSGPGGTAFSGTFDPAMDQAGVYTYTIAVPPPCVSQSSTVTVDLSIPAEPGQNAVLALCSTGAITNLFDQLGGSPDPGGSWYDPMGDPIGSGVDPAMALPGTYVYTVSSTAPCPAVSASVDLFISPAADAGGHAILNLCETGAAQSLFPALTGSPDLGGSWTAPGGLPSSGIFSPGLDAAGNYTYTVQGTAPCPDVQAVITVNTLTDPDAGAPGQSTVCGSDAVVDLFSLLLGSPDPGGVWTDPNGVAHASTFDPAIDPSGIYTYLVTVPPPCISAQSTVSMTVVSPPNAGADGSVALCESDATQDLFALLGGSPDMGGTWTDQGGLAVAGLFAPGTTNPGVFTYSVVGQTPCPDAQALVTVLVDQLPNAGIDSAITVCPDASAIDLFTILGGTPDTGGSWSDPNGMPASGTFIPGLDPEGAYTYTVQGTTACPDSSAEATVNIFLIASPDAGPDTFSCNLEYTLSAIGNWTSGAWSGPSSVSFLDAADPNTVVTAALGGQATLYWTITTSDGCAAEDSATITFTDAITPLIGTVDALCNAQCDGSATLFVPGVDLSDHTFQWSYGIAGITDTIATGLCAGSYSVIISDTNGCTTDAPFVIGEPPPLVIDLVTQTDETCPGSCDGSVEVIDPAGVQYSFDGGLTFQASSTISGLCAGTYAITMLDANGCVAEATAPINSPDPVIAAFTADPEQPLVSDPLVQFINTSTNGTSYFWDIAGLASSTAVSPSYLFPSALGSSYEVCLTAMNENGCVDSVCHSIQILDLITVFVPNAFTPNGDAINEGFMPVFNFPELVENYEFLVFDRWGELLFESHMPHEPWTGVYRSSDVQQDVYVWKLNYIDGRSRLPGSAIGHVTVVK